MAQDAAPIIIIKKKVNHGGHHGGAWKVAYADFVTAMMALFIVLWLLNSSVQVRKAISAYFQDPLGTGNYSGSAAAGTGEAISLGPDDMTKLQEKLENAIKKSPELKALKDYVQMSVTGEGLRIELLESDKGMFFQSGSGKPSPLGEEMIVRLTKELIKLHNDLLIEGHTDAKPFGAQSEYTNWELSTDRANSARRLMEASGLAPGRVVQVRGFASQKLRDPQHPEDAKNRRISVIVRYQNAVNVEEPKEPKGPGEAEGGEAKGEGKAESKGEAKPGEKTAEPAKAEGHH